MLRREGCNGGPVSEEKESTDTVETAKMEAESALCDLLLCDREPFVRTGSAGEPAGACTQQLCPLLHGTVAGKICATMAKPW